MMLPICRGDYVFHSEGTPFESGMLWHLPAPSVTSQPRI